MRSNSLQIYAAAIAFVVGLSSLAAAQSADQNFPTPVTANEIAGTIRARDIGDPRLTTYFYEFGGDQGDVFINVVTKNFDGDIDIFTVDGLRPLTKIVIYSDVGAGETGRIVYLRKPEQILLRIQGRSPDDMPATFRIKFAGSFFAMRPKRGGDAVKAPEIGQDESGEVPVNSVGTRIDVPPKPKVEITEEPAEKEAPKTGKPAAATRKAASTAKAKTTPTRKAGTTAAKPARKIEPDTAGNETTEKKPVTAAAKKSNTAKSPPSKPEPEPMANFRLVIEFKDGKTIERPMIEIVRFGVERGTLTVVYKDGYIGRYSMVIVAKVSMETP